MLLLEIPLAEAALRAGAAAEYDRHIQAFESRSQQILACTPRDAFVWLLAFDLEVMHGLLNGHSFDLLAMSYAASPNEAWIFERAPINSRLASDQNRAARPHPTEGFFGGVTESPFLIGFFANSTFYCAAFGSGIKILS